MTERLSDERLAEIIEDEDDWPSCEEAHDMARELLALRRAVAELRANTLNAAIDCCKSVAEIRDHEDDQLFSDGWAEGALGCANILRGELAELRAAGPVMPEIPSEAVMSAMWSMAMTLSQVFPERTVKPKDVRDELQHGYRAIRAALIKGAEKEL